MSAAAPGVGAPLRKQPSPLPLVWGHGRGAARTESQTEHGSGDTAVPVASGLSPPPTSEGAQEREEQGRRGCRPQRLKRANSFFFKGSDVQPGCTYL